jgi:hypothetical protein
MRAIIDADNLPTAVRYYTAFPGEPSQQLKNFISIDRLDAMHHLTLESVLGTIDNSGEKEFLLVLHSNPTGLVLPIGAGPLAAVNADQTVLRIIQLASVVFDLLDDSKNPDIAVNTAFLNAWMDFFSNAPQANTASISQASGVAAKCAEAAKLGQLWVGSACTAMHTTEAALRRIAGLADKVRRSGLTRIEFRSCRLGAGSGLKEVASFFGAMSFAPTVRTFYVHQPVQIVRVQAQLNRTAAGLGPHSRRFTAANGVAGPHDDVAFTIQVNRLEDHRYHSRMFAISEQAVFNWVSRFIERLPTAMTVNAVQVPVRTGRTFVHDLVVAGFWTPNSVRPFVFCGEPEYPGFIEGQF